MNLTASDVLLYAMLRFEPILEWTTEPLMDTPESAALWDFYDDLRHLTARAKVPLFYSDGRFARTEVAVENGFSVSHTWSPDPAVDKPFTWEGRLSVDPGQPDRGGYVVRIVPPQSVTVTLTPPRPSLQLVDTSAAPSATEQHASFDAVMHHITRDGGAE